jgi:hypothetical protein
MSGENSSLTCPKSYMTSASIHLYKCFRLILLACRENNGAAETSSAVPVTMAYVTGRPGSRLCTVLTVPWKQKEENQSCVYHDLKSVGSVWWHSNCVPKLKLPILGQSHQHNEFSHDGRKATQLAKLIHIRRYCNLSSEIHLHEIIIANVTNNILERLLLPETDDN